MMKNLLFTLLFSAVSFLGFSQVDINPSSIEWVTNGEDQLELLIDITNNSGEEQGLFWDFTPASNHPENWSIYICDNNICYPPNRLYGSNTPNELMIGETRTWKFKVINSDGALEGNSHGILRLYSDVERTNLVAESSEPVVSVSDVEVEDIVIYPNPTMEHFQLKNDANVNTVSVYSIVGRQVKKFNHTQNAMHDVSDLRTGMYLVRLENSDGEVIKAMRLSKR